MFLLIESVAMTWVGALPPTVTVTESIDCWPLPAVTTSSPHCAVLPPYCACCCTAQAGTGVGLQVAYAVVQVVVRPGTVTVICASFQLCTIAFTPPMVTLETVLQVALPAVGVMHCVPKP